MGRFIILENLKFKNGTVGLIKVNAQEREVARRTYDYYKTHHDKIENKKVIR